MRSAESFCRPDKIALFGAEGKAAHQPRWPGPTKRANRNNDNQKGVQRIPKQR